MIWQRGCRFWAVSSPGGTGEHISKRNEVQRNTWVIHWMKVHHQWSRILSFFLTEQSYRVIILGHSCPVLSLSDSTYLQAMSFNIRELKIYLSLSGAHAATCPTMSQPWDKQSEPSHMDQRNKYAAFCAEQIRTSDKSSVPSLSPDCQTYHLALLTR